MGGLIKQCCGCGKINKDFGWFDGVIAGKDAGSVTHGWCPKCFRVELCSIRAHRENQGAKIKLLYEWKKKNWTKYRKAMGTL